MQITKKEKAIFWTVLITSIVIFLLVVSDILFPFIVGALVAYFLDPVADKLESSGLSRTSATSAIIVIFSLIMIVMCLMVFPVLYDQLLDLYSNIPNIISSLQEKFNSTFGEVYQRIQNIANGDNAADIGSKASDASKIILKFITDFLTSIIESGIALLNLLSLVFISPIVAFYMLRDYDKIVAKIDGWLPLEYAETIREQLSLIDTTLSGFVRGAINVCILQGIFYAICLSMAGLQYGLLIGFSTGILSFIPYVGMLIGMSTGLAVAFFQFGLADGGMNSIMIVLAIFIVGQILEGNFLTPKLVGDKVGLHALWIMFGLLAGGSLFGFTGVLIAIPVSATLGVISRFLLSEYLNSTYYSGAGNRNAIAVDKEKDSTDSKGASLKKKSGSTKTAIKASAKKNNSASNNKAKGSGTKIKKTKK